MTTKIFERIETRERELRTAASRDAHAGSGADLYISQHPAAHDLRFTHPEEALRGWAPEYVACGQMPDLIYRMLRGLYMGVGGSPDQLSRAPTMYPRHFDVIVHQVRYSPQAPAIAQNLHNGMIPWRALLSAVGEHCGHATLRRYLELENAIVLRPPTPVPTPSPTPAKEPNMTAQKTDMQRGIPSTLDTIKAATLHGAKVASADEAANLVLELSTVVLPDAATLLLGSENGRTALKYITASMLIALVDANALPILAKATPILTKLALEGKRFSSAAAGG